MKSLHYLVALSAATLAVAAGALVPAAPAAAASLVECESESGFWDCWLPSGYYSQRWYLDGVLLSSFNNSSSAYGWCVNGTGHHVRVTFDGGGRSSTSFTCGQDG